MHDEYIDPLLFLQCFGCVARFELEPQIFYFTIKGKYTFDSCSLCYKLCAVIIKI